MSNNGMDRFPQNEISSLQIGGQMEVTPSQLAEQSTKLSQSAARKMTFTDKEAASGRRFQGSGSSDSQFSEYQFTNLIAEARNNQANDNDNRSRSKSFQSTESYTMFDEESQISPQRIYSKKYLKNMSYNRQRDLNIINNDIDIDRLNVESPPTRKGSILTGSLTDHKPKIMSFIKQNGASIFVSSKENQITLFKGDRGELQDFTEIDIRSDNKNSIVGQQGLKEGSANKKIYSQQYSVAQTKQYKKQQGNILGHAQRNQHWTQQKNNGDNYLNPSKDDINEYYDNRQDQQIRQFHLNEINDQNIDDKGAINGTGSLSAKPSRTQSEYRIKKGKEKAAVLQASGGLEYQNITSPSKLVMARDSKAGSNNIKKNQNQPSQAKTQSVKSQPQKLKMSQADLKKYSIANGRASRDSMSSMRVRIDIGSQQYPGRNIKSNASVKNNGNAHISDNRADDNNKLSKLQQRPVPDPYAPTGNLQYDDRESSKISFKEATASYCQTDQKTSNLKTFDLQRNQSPAKIRVQTPLRKKRQQQQQSKFKKETENKLQSINQKRMSSKDMEGEHSLHLKSPQMLSPMSASKGPVVNSSIKNLRAGKDRSLTALPEIVQSKLKQANGQSDYGLLASTQMNHIPNTNQQRAQFQRETLQQKNTLDTLTSPNKNKQDLPGSIHVRKAKETEQHQESPYARVDAATKKTLAHCASSFTNQSAPSSGEREQIEAFQEQAYERIPNGDLVIYDRTARIMKFENKSTKTNEVYLYQDLDFQELKKQIDAQSFKPLVGCNEVKQRDLMTGKPIYQQAENTELLDLHNAQKTRFDTKQGLKDQQRVQEIKEQYSKLKKIKDFDKELYLPPHCQRQCVLFYSRFESGNLHRVVRRQLCPQEAIEGLISGDQIDQLRGAKIGEGPCQLGVDVMQISFEHEYDLYLQYDTNSDGLMHWFYFRAITKNLEKGTRIKLNIRNLHRSKSLYECGMLPRIYYANQDKVPGSGKEGWHVDPRVTYGIHFSKSDQSNNFDPECMNKQRTYHTLSFIYEVQSLNESVYFAYDQPYTYSQNLKSFVDEVRNNMKFNNILRVASLCKSLGGNECKLLTITENIKFCLDYYEQLKTYSKKDIRDRYAIRQEVEKLCPAERKQIIQNAIKVLKHKQKEKSGDGSNQDASASCNQQQEVGIEQKYFKHILMNYSKRCMIVTARVHPGETQASFALEGIVGFLLSDHARAKELRKKYIFQIVPILNPDGVIQGNHRTDLHGTDNNRRWAEPSPWLHPVIYAVRHLAYIVKEERPIDVFCDIHGHFQPCGGFMYCCSYDKGNGVQKSEAENDANLRVIPHLLSNKNEYFSMKHCSFSMEAYKAGSARQAMFNDFKILNSFTVENSFFARYTEEEREAINSRIQKRIENLSASRSQKDRDPRATPSQLQNNDQSSGVREPDTHTYGDQSNSSSSKSHSKNSPRHSPRHIYDNVLGCHHFTGTDHMKLGEDLCHILYKVFASSRDKDKEKTKAALSKFVHALQQPPPQPQAAKK